MHTPVSSRQHRMLVASQCKTLCDDIGDFAPLFYRTLYRICPETETVFKGTDLFRHRKLLDTLQFIGNLKYLEMLDKLFLDLGHRHQTYHRQYQRFVPSLLAAMIEAASLHLGSMFDDESRLSWEKLLDDVRQAMGDTPPPEIERRQPDHSPYQGPERRMGAGVRQEAGLLEDIGGPDVVQAVHNTFYHAMFQDPWLGKFFIGKHESILSAKQTRFMLSAFGGLATYSDASPAFVHMHMHITPEQADIREQYLRWAIRANHLSDSIADRWLAIDRIYRPSIVKQSTDDCTLICVGQYPIEAEKPAGYTLALPPLPRTD